MKIKLITMSTFLVLSLTSTAQAASNAQMTITANVVAATCDVSVSNSHLDLGNYTPSQFTNIATPISSSIKTFTIGLSNCDAPLAENDTANLLVSGQTLGGNPAIFNSTGTNTGIMLSEVATPGTYIESGDKLLVAQATATPSASNFNNKSLSLQAGLASSSTTANIGQVNAPILFSFVYN